MSSLAQIKADAIKARKAKSPEAKVLVTLLGEIDTKSKTLAPGKNMTDADVVAIVRKFLKGVDETLKLLDADKAPDAVAYAKAERAALEVYLPKQMTEAEIEAFVRAKVSEGANIGQIMGSLKQEKAGQYDGKIASQVAKSLLAAA
ncbi:GatB/YqeY domain-containing protein [Sulfitobacter sp. R18_1]|uniref:GatB/YqeY domain-containing protein n=1 Tax=Sulfitobacter sp. R18_1 TaxID=2821104 RepID=UPI001ADD1B35|nr:GatB/YqeY domain-containing protein [Sulfitobacter sp. R18_1]MBO9428680.1 GatB/YqeY domain-containing protein [Sulfitobacter sp. R18_1]